MNPHKRSQNQKLDALRSLAARKLPVPRVMSVQDLRNADPNSEVYVRGEKTNSELNRRMKIPDAISLVQSLIDSKRLEELQTIEANPTPCYSGVLYLDQFSNLYVEVVEGHLSLLTNGRRCGLRLYINSNLSVVSYIRCRQGKIVEQGADGLSSKDIEPDFSDHKILQLSKTLLPRLEFFERGDLAEWFMDDEYNLLFIDLKDNINITDHLYIFREEIHRIEEGMMYSMPLPVQVSEPKGRIAGRDHGQVPVLVEMPDDALLSHYLTDRHKIPHEIHFGVTPRIHTVLL